MCLCVYVFVYVLVLTYLSKEEVVMNLEEGGNTGGVAEERRRSGNGINTVFMNKISKNFN